MDTASSPRPGGRSPRAVALLLLVLLIPGCWTSKQEGQALRRDVEQLKKELQQATLRSQQERIQLQKIMEKATALLTRNSADVGAQVERIQAKVSKLNGWMDESKVALKELQETFADWKAKVDVKLEGLSGQSAGNKNAPVPEDKDELFKTIEAKFSAGDHQETRRLARHFITRFGDDKRVDKAQLLLGDSYFAEQKFAPAIVEYKKVIEKHKGSPYVADAFYKIGMSFYQLKFCSDAQLFLSQLTKRYRKHSQIKRAQKVLGLIRRYRKNRKFCRP